MILLNLSIKHLARCTSINNHWWIMIHQTGRLREKLFLQHFQGDNRSLELVEISKNEFKPTVFKGAKTGCGCKPIVKLHHSLAPPQIPQREGNSKTLHLTIWKKWEDIFLFPASDQPRNPWTQAYICLPPVKYLELTLEGDRTHRLMQVRNEAGIRIWDVNKALGEANADRALYRQMNGQAEAEPGAENDGEEDVEEGMTDDESEYDGDVIAVAGTGADEAVVEFTESKPKKSSRRRGKPACNVDNRAETTLKMCFWSVFSVDSDLVKSAILDDGAVFERHRGLLRKKQSSVSRQ